MNWEVIIKWLPRLAEGAVLTLELVAIAVVAGLILAIPMGIARASKHWYVRSVPYAYIFFFRGTPLLVQLFLLYYGLSQFDAIRNSALWTGTTLTQTFALGDYWSWDFSLRIKGLRDPFVCAVVTMTLHTAAYIAEIIRGAIQSVPPGEVEAARALGMSRAQTMLYIILPRAARIGLPAYSNEVILMLKASSLASTVTLLELTGMARTIIARTYLPVEIFFAAGMFYLLIAFILVHGFKQLERWLRVDACQGR
jgi:polar amino acid transport system permease protein